MTRILRFLFEISWISRTFVQITENAAAESKVPGGTDNDHINPHICRIIPHICRIMACFRPHNYAHHFRILSALFCGDSVKFCYVWFVLYDSYYVYQNWTQFHHNIPRSLWHFLSRNFSALFPNFLRKFLEGQAHVPVSTRISSICMVRVCERVCECVRACATELFLTLIICAQSLVSCRNFITEHKI